MNLSREVEVEARLLAQLLFKTYFSESILRYVTIMKWKLFLKLLNLLDFCCFMIISYVQWR